MLNALLSCDVFNEDCSLKPRSDKIWKNASDLLLPNKVSPDTLNFYVRNNRWNLQDDLKKAKNIVINAEITNSTLDLSSSSAEYVPYEVVENKNPDSPLLFFNMDLTENEWRSIYPKLKIYRNKNNNRKSCKMLKSGWTDVVANAYFRKTKIPCVFYV